MSHDSLRTPYIPNAKPLTAEGVDLFVDSRRISYYGIMPPGTKAEGRVNHPAITIEDDSGVSEFSVLISGDLLNAKKILIKAMSWTEHPGRGFEALREAIISDNQDKLAVISVSFPGAGLNSLGMTKKQRESLKGENGGFDYIGAQQWQAVLEAMAQELTARGLYPGEIDHKLKGYEYILAGNSQGATNAVGLLQSAPEGLVIPSLGLIQNTSWEHRGPLEFRRVNLTNNRRHFGEYTEVNPYNEYPPLGPGQNTTMNILTRPASHIFAVVEAMRRGDDVNKILQAVREQERHELVITLGAASEDAQSDPELNRKVAATLNASGLVLAKTVVWKDHYHPVMENLANAKTAFREVARY